MLLRKEKMPFFFFNNFACRVAISNKSVVAIIESLFLTWKVENFENFYFDIIDAHFSFRNANRMNLCTKSAIHNPLKNIDLPKFNPHQAHCFRKTSRLEREREKFMFFFWSITIAYCFHYPAFCQKISCVLFCITNWDSQLSIRVDRPRVQSLVLNLYTF